MLPKNLTKHKKKDKVLSYSLKTLSGEEELSRQTIDVFYDVGNIPKNMWYALENG